MRCWKEINLDDLRKNVIELEKITAKKNIMTVVKANAYGHGMIEIFDELVNVGITWFGIATFEEAMALRERNKEVNILIFGPIEKSSMKIASENDLRFPIVSFDEIDYLNSNNINCNIHVKIDTGMGRVGFQYQDAEKAIELIKNSSTINIEGIFSHLSSSESNEEYTRSQIEKFDLIVKNHKEIKYKHILNSFGSVLYQDSIYDFIRPGIILYGGVTEDETSPYKFNQVMSLHARISFVKEMLEDGYISYGNKYKAQKGEKIATISIGYADGVRRELANKGSVLYKGHKCKIVGTVCMDQLMVLIPKEIAVVVDEYVEIFGENISAVEVAEICETISYEIVCGVSQRVPRKYINRK